MPVGPISVGHSWLRKDVRLKPDPQDRYRRVSEITEASDFTGAEHVMPRQI